MKVAREKLQRRMQTRCSQELAAALYRQVNRSEFKFKGRNRQIEFPERIDGVETGLASTGRNTYDYINRSYNYNHISLQC